MRLRECYLVVVVVATLACQRTPAPGQTPPAPGPSPGSIARCGGAVSPAGFQNVLAGTDNAFFTARTRQSLKIKPEVEVKANQDGKGQVISLTMRARNNSVDISCACPGGV